MLTDLKVSGTPGGAALVLVPAILRVIMLD